MVRGRGVRTGFVGIKEEEKEEEEESGVEEGNGPCVVALSKLTMDDDDDDDWDGNGRLMPSDATYWLNSFRLLKGWVNRIVL